jgi:protein-L-isoaspartate(D-aspartate) O-methyltransferase
VNTPVEAFRSFYARRTAAMAGIPAVESRLAAAFESVPRERFLGKGPWRVLTPTGYISTPSDDPAFLYQDIVVALSGDGPVNMLTGEGPINNGQPSLQATCLGNVNPVNGETVLHIGAGTGYYTALLATLVGLTGVVVAYEVVPQLAERAAANLAGFAHVTVHNRSGSEGPLRAADIIYVNAGATAPLDIWLDALRIGGRLVFPLTPAAGIGGMLLVARQSDEDFSANFISPAMFIPCIGARDDKTAQRLTDAFRRGGLGGVNSLHRNTPVDASCWFGGEGWWLSTSSLP